MVRRRDLLIGAGAAALGACAPKLREPTSPAAASPAVTPSAPVAVPSGTAAHWAPYRDTISIDGAGGIWLVYPDDTPPDEVARLIAAEVAHARASGLTAVVTTIAPQGRFWLNDAAFEKTRRDLAAWTC